jgi:hypothetical protein
MSITEYVEGRRLPFHIHARGRTSAEAATTANSSRRRSELNPTI